MKKLLAVLMLISLAGIFNASAAASEINFPNKVINLGMVVSDMNKSLSFYKDIIGMVQVDRTSFDVDADFGERSGLTKRIGFHVEVVKLGSGSNATELKLISFGRTAQKQNLGYIHDRTGVRYLTIYVDELAPIVERIKKNDIKMLGETPTLLTEGISFILVKDPDETFVELIGPMVKSTTPVEKKEPPIVSALPCQPPSDAVILFDGTDLSKWTYKDGSQAGWIVKNGEMTVKGGSIVTKQHFGDMQMHVEFCEPLPAEGEGQKRGNSGVYIHGVYEVQVLDSYENSTYPDGQCGAVYEQYIPLINASRPPGIWQTYDIIFHAGRFDENGSMTKKPYVTVLHNGVLIQDHVEILGPTRGSMKREEQPTGPIMLQDHRNPVKYRNIWVRPLNN